MPDFTQRLLSDPPVAVALLITLLAGLMLMSFLYLRGRRQVQWLTQSLDEAQQQVRDQDYQQALQAQQAEQIASQRDELKDRLAELEGERASIRDQVGGLESRNAALDAEGRARAERLQQLESERAALQAKADQLAQELHDHRARLRESEAVMAKEQRVANEKLELLERNRDALKQEFENLANKIFEQKNERFSQQTRSSLDTLLNPFRDQLQDFRKRVEDVYTTETKDRQALRSEIKSLQELNRQITEEAANLTKALKGDKKIQGNWGELILERVLERSGLRKGIEYETQGSYRDGDGNLLRPDVIVHLPDSRNLVVDSKVSLVAYQQWVTEEDEGLRADALKTHVEAVRAHIRALSEKDYSQLNGLHSPDFVLLFMPIEPAFVAAFQQDENLFAEAFERKIIVVTPTTLLATLRTIENIWRYERQSQNARRIADRAGAVYDKLRVFVEAMEKLGGQLQTAQGTYDGAMNTLTRGRGNLVSQANRFVELGVRVKKELPKSILDQAEVDVDAGDDEAPLRRDEASSMEREQPEAVEEK
ncbi:DNA recombination protein RmuC [Marinobacter sp. SS21]|uniref:DNA recombination protein RmuC n=1 Tax=Marinobacter sp. SS21 TaxID=2979460 RepID=UPI002330FC15|nr:DNA recombination protein RmuC [Marinobacter sp. SS21]MDC0663817.1 DNA recombination protein RmuC [Marinobacter sp. SS21]